MERSVALETVKEHLTEHRYEHTIGVMETAIQLAEKYGANVAQAELAAIFHDYAKFRPKDEMKSIILKEHLRQDYLQYGDELLHAPVGAHLVKGEVGIKDEEVLQAICYHTTGRPNMSLLEKIIYLADYIEPGRSFKGVDQVRELAQNSLDEAIIQSLINTINFLMKKKQPVFPDTLATYNQMVRDLKKEGRS
ncbi:bis(5'-nucleosyl)-tetraphosphatase (symmetrical) YqeK [Desertibacillus haloalkaliphilus]|uniref:bis(5'-nucleosyl)-tetraphosphatase (symmetrical) YqeK n=1 Tax=Desertibacillus haloalkaliphilus TaxID=1328930 RepID=UPI001C27DC63|nr:bis(5'-nucleosyl)-tetraphosphatase (symmetrical) YqeK [Desertibacillus haloalkaliphilus]MBU8905612.1 bis(5'-nucleosyl)-tetraphosphatase (symmetrical) YqeK [Desertibacillus haloalkaliphilus]